MHCIKRYYCCGSFVILKSETKMFQVCIEGQEALEEPAAHGGAGKITR
jgi:hypothetical protein